MSDVHVDIFSVYLHLPDWLLGRGAGGNLARTGSKFMVSISVCSVQDLLSGIGVMIQPNGHNEYSSLRYVVLLAGRITGSVDKVPLSRVQPDSIQPGRNCNGVKKVHIR